MMLAADDAIPKKKVNSTNKYRIHWWDDDIAESVQARRIAFSLYCSNPTFENYMEARQKRAETKNLIRYKKKKNHAKASVKTSLLPAFTEREKLLKNFQLTLPLASRIRPINAV
ncbi:hypothetical protein HHI36_008017 [Cryptolaemus montrouzieri]|uniref:Uncharacterized protein n=1 Tax=Cryptolaemus montrouzieri TaxID=559131 RepID=A0ABD2MRA9_9CUCU